MENAADEFRTGENDIVDENKVSDITVLCGGTWQKRGYASLNGVVTVIGN